MATDGAGRLALLLLVTVTVRGPAVVPVGTLPKLILRGVTLTFGSSAPGVKTTAWPAAMALFRSHAATIATVKAARRFARRRCKLVAIAMVRRAGALLHCKSTRPA